MCTGADSMVGGRDVNLSTLHNFKVLCGESVYFSPVLFGIAYFTQCKNLSGMQ